MGKGLSRKYIIQLKAGSLWEKIELIEKENPTWRDYFDDI
jgi:hypothetical protein